MANRQILARISVWAMSTRPDIVLLHLGHNDLWQGKGTANTLQDLAGILEHLRRVNPRVSILIAQIIPSASIPVQLTAEFNDGIAELAPATSTGSSPVIVVDHSTGFHVETMTRDGTHPNDDGERRMADRWYDALRPLLLKGVPMRSTARGEVTTGGAGEIDNGRRHIGRDNIRQDGEQNLSSHGG